MSEIAAQTAEDETQPTDSDPGPVGQFSGDRSTVFWMQVRFMLLTVATLGIYRFWAKTKTRRYFWSHARIAGDSLEYLGTAKELLIGFLIALAILIPIYLAMAAAESMTATSPETAALLAGAGGIGFVLFMQAALYRMWRYRLMRTAWRGVRFGMDGSTVKFVLLSVLYFMVSALTLGLAVPWMRVALARYRINNARFGDRKFQCDASGGALFLPWLVVYLTFGLGAVWYLVREFNTVVSATRFGESTIRTKVRAAPVYGWLLLTTAVFFGVAFVVVMTANLGTNIALQAGSLDPTLITATFVGTWFVGGILLLVAVMVMLISFVLFEVAKQACNSLQVSDVAAFEAVAQSSVQEPMHGEGLADALDVGAF